MDKHKLEELNKLIVAAEEQLMLAKTGNTEEDYYLRGCMRSVLIALSIVKSELSKGKQNG